MLNQRRSRSKIERNGENTGMSKWENTRIGKLTGGLFRNHNEMCRIINVNADVLQECCQRVRELEEKVEQLKRGEAAPENLWKL